MPASTPQDLLLTLLPKLDSVVLGIAMVLAGSAALLCWLNWRFFAPRRRQKFIVQFLARMEDADPRAYESADNGTLLCNDVGLSLTTKKNETHALRWPDIEEVHAFKRELWSVDLVCLAFKAAGRNGLLEVNEEMRGYFDLLQTMPGRLPGFSDVWFTSVAFPAFARNHRVIWQRRPAAC